MRSRSTKHGFSQEKKTRLQKKKRMFTKCRRFDCITSFPILISSALSLLLLIYCIIYYLNCGTAGSRLTYLDIGNFGRLGNQVFQVASTIGIAMDNNMEWVFPKHIEQTEVGLLFSIKGEVLNANQVGPTIEETSQTFEQVIIPKPYIGLVSLHGYYQSFRYFDHHQEVLRDVLKLRRTFIEEVLSKFPEIRDEGSVGIHVRRGDYLHDHYKNLYTQINFSYFERALQHIPKVNRLYIVSDDLAWCKRHFQNLPFPVFYGNGDLYSDFAVIALSHSLIIPNSSFGWWAAYIKYLQNNNGTVIAPKPWYAEGGKLEYLNQNAENFYMKQWRLVDAN